LAGGREPTNWRERFRKRRERAIVQMQADKNARKTVASISSTPAAIAFDALR